MKTNSLRNPCRICNSANTEPHFTVKQYTYYRCLQCETLFVHPLPSEAELTQFYNSLYRVEPSSSSELSVAKWNNALVTISRYSRPPGRILDIGSSWGGFLFAARQYGWSVHGVEVSTEAAEYSKSKLGLEVCNGVFEDSPYATQQFDAIVSWHVIEHTTDPCSFLRAAGKCVRPGGILALTTPNVASFIARISGSSWEWATPPAHLYLLTPKAIQIAIKEAGFQVIELNTRRGDAHPFAAEVGISLLKRANLTRVMRSMLKMPAMESKDHARRSPAHNPRLQMAMKAIDVIDWISTPVKPLGKVLDRMFNFGPEMFIIAQKSQ